MLTVLRRKIFGFSLLKTLLFVFVIGILAVIVATSLFFVRKKEVDSIKVNNLKKIANILEIYYDKHANYPLSLNDLVAEKIVPALPVLPQSSGNNNYEYVPLGDNKICTGYHLGIALETWSNDLSLDADSKVGTPCLGALGKDFDGTALNCKTDSPGRGAKEDNCFDIRI